MNKNPQEPNIEQERANSDYCVFQELDDGGGQQFKKIQSVCVILPIYNEADNISFVSKDILSKLLENSYNAHILFVNDGSKDNSLRIVKHLCSQNPRIHYISFSRNFGKEAALMAGLQECRDHYDAIAYMDSDGQHTVDDLLMLIQHTENTGCDLTCGARADRNYQNGLQRFLSNSFYRCFHFLTNQSIEKGVGDFNVMRSKVVLALCEFKERDLFMKGIISWIGFRREIVNIHIVDRKGGVSKSSTLRMVKLAVSAIMSFSSWPLRLWSFVGFFSSFLSFLYLCFIIFQKIHFGINIPGYATIIVILLGLGGIQLLSVGIIGEYISRMYESSQNRPRYIIDERSS
ncbi:glycosyltransferase family 2 protein [Acetobacter sp. LMG 32666]|uniref:glycosyltransferase family 2 protein n=1 Tax=Acetobacter sp. LMG 32666 TaxID=2959295 RepID=UPI0030C8BDFC